MAITTTSLGTFTKQFSISGEAGMSGIISAVDGWLTTSVQPGWSLYDSVTSADGGGIITKVYRVLNADETSYKYLILRYLTLKWQILTSTCESWNTGTHVPTNEAWSFNDTMPVGMQPNSCDLVVFASPRYAIFQSFYRNDPGIWQGVVETEREAPEDTAAAGYPCWAWINGQTYLQSYSSANQGSDATGTGFFALSYPRTRNGSTGVAASNSHYFTSPYDGRQGSTASFADYLSTNALTYGWDTNKKVIHAPRPLHPVATAIANVYGRTYGLKVIPPVGEIMNKVAVPVDSNKFFSASGSNADHWILPLCGKNMANAYAASATGGNYTTTAISGGADIQTPTCIVTNGLAYYIGTVNGSKILKVDAATGSVTSITTAAVVVDMCYDGAQYIYAVTNNTTSLLKIDTLNNDSITTLTLPASGGWCITQDYANVFVAKYAAATTPQIYQISKATFTTTATYTGNYTLSVSQAAGAMCTDYEGNLFWTHITGGTAADNRVYKTVISTGSTANITPGYSSQVACCGIHYDPVAKRIYQTFGTVTSAMVSMYYTPASTFTGVTSCFVNVTRTIAFSSYNVKADIVPLNGGYNIQYRASSYASSGLKVYSNSSGVFSSNVASIFGGNGGASGCNILATDNIRFLTTDYTNSYFTINGSMNNKYVRNVATVNAQVLIPV